MGRSPLRFAAVAFVLFAIAIQHAGVFHTNAGSEAPAGNTAIQSFNKAKKLMRQVFAGHERTLYCGCAYRENTVDLQSCGYQPQTNAKRATARMGARGAGGGLRASISRMAGRTPGMR